MPNLEPNPNEFLVAFGLPGRSDPMMEGIPGQPGILGPEGVPVPAWLREQIMGEVEKLRPIPPEPWAITKKIIRFFGGRP